jgi:hypothetical protein
MATIIGAIGDLDLQANQRTQQKLSCAATAATTGRTIGTSAQRAGTDSLPPTGQGKGKASTTSASNTKQKKGQDLGQDADKDGGQGEVPSTKVRAEMFNPPPSKSEESLVASAVIPPVPQDGLECVPSQEDTGRTTVACPGGVGNERM